MRAVCVLSLLVASAHALQHRDPVETIGNTAGAVGSGVSDVTAPVAGPVGDVAGTGVTTVGDGVGSAATSAGDATGAGKNPMEKVPVVGSNFKVHPVATSINCVVNLTIQFFIVYTALAVVRTMADIWNLNYDKVPVQKILQTATKTVNYAPMLAVLFLATRMRVTWLTQGQGNPPTYIQVWMYCCTYAVLMMTLVICVIPLFTGETIGVDPKTGDIADEAKPFDNWILATCFTILKYLIMIGLYVGAVVIIYGTINYVPEKHLQAHGELPPVSPAVACTMILASQFFIVYAGMQFARTWTQFTGMKTTRLENACETATLSMYFAQKWAQNCFYMCSYALLAQTLFSFAVPLVLQGKAKKGEAEGDMIYEVQYPVLGSILSVGRYLILFCIYIGAGCVIYSVFTIQHPKGDQYTPPISVTMQCVVNLTFQFFFIYIMIYLCITVKELTQYEWKLLSNTMYNLIGTVAFCPMLAILFVGTRMRALRITDNKGAPQGWAQDGMYMATWALLIQFLFGLLVPLCTGQETPCDEDGTPKYEPKNPIALYVVLALKWLTYIFLYGGAITVVVGVYTMTPETANGRGSVPIAGDYVGEPKGVNDLANAVGF